MNNKTWIVVIARNGKCMTNEMTLVAAQKKAQAMNGAAGETIYICRSI